MAKTIDVILETGLNKNNPLYNNYYISNALDESQGKVFLGDNLNKKCRFCGKKSSSTSFRKKAHIIPDFMGNKLFFSNYECDTCNDYIGNLEDSLANFGGIFNSLSTLKGKRGYQKFKDDKNGMEISAEDNQTVIARVDDPHNSGIEYDKENQKMKFDVNQPGYYPQHVFKSLVKIALLMMSDEDFNEYKNAVKWINSKELIDHTNNPYFILFRNFGGRNTRFIQPWCILFKRKDSENSKNLPEHSLLLFYGILVYQIFIPFHKNENDLLKNDKIHFSLTEDVLGKVEIKNNQVQVALDKVQLGGIEKIKSKKMKFSFGFQEEE